MKLENSHFSLSKYFCTNISTREHEHAVPLFPVSRIPTAVCVHFLYTVTLLVTNVDTEEIDTLSVLSSCVNACLVCY